MPDDPSAIVFTQMDFDAYPDGSRDNTKALQKAIDMVEQRDGKGIVFIPEGIYLFCGTVNLWRGIRLIGFGKKRPRFVLGDHSDGFSGPLSQYLIFCRNVKPKPGEFLRDANECTFYTSLRNIDIDLGHGNHGAVAVRYHVAQLCSLEDCDFYLRDAKAAIEFVGNEVERCRFFGGTYGIIGYYTAPGWQFYVGDCLFEGQSRACIMSSKTGLTLVRNSFRNAPWAVYVPNKELYDVPVNETERLYMEDCRAENMSTSVISMGWLRNLNNWLHVTGTICRNAPMFLEAYGYQFVYFFLEPSIITDYSCYQVETHIGFQVAARNREIKREFSYEHQITETVWSPVPESSTRSYQNISQWRSILDFGASGDGITDDTKAIESAIAQCSVIYFPMGKYRLSRGITLRENTSLVALHPGKTTIFLDDKAYPDREYDAAMLTIPPDGHNHISGLGFDGGVNPGSTTVLWQGAEDSLMEDCQFWPDTKLERTNIVNADKPAEQFRSGRRPQFRHGLDQRHTLWIRKGGGEFKNLWSNDKRAQEGLYISDTDKLGRMYLISVEHHGEVEIMLEQVTKWMLISMQTEEAYCSDYAMAIRCVQCRNVTFANLFAYRMQSFEVSFPYAVRLEQCRQMTFWGIHAFSNGPNGWDNAALLPESDGWIRDCEIGTLLVNHL